MIHLYLDSSKIELLIKRKLPTPKLLPIPTSIHPSIPHLQPTFQSYTVTQPTPMGKPFQSFQKHTTQQTKYRWISLLEELKSRWISYLKTPLFGQIIYQIVLLSRKGCLSTGWCYKEPKIKGEMHLLFQIIMTTFVNTNQYLRDQQAIKKQN